jgi:hypothetical protein
VSLLVHLLSVHRAGLGGGGGVVWGCFFLVLFALGLLARVEEIVVEARLDVGQTEAGHVCRPVLAVLARHVAAVGVLVAGASGGNTVHRLLLHRRLGGGGVVAHRRRTLTLLRHHFRLLLLGCLQKGEGLENYIYN